MTVADDLTKEINGLMLEADQLHAKAVQMQLKTKRLKCGYNLRGKVDNACYYMNRVVEDLTDAEEIAKED